MSHRPGRTLPAAGLVILWFALSAAAPMPDRERLCRAALDRSLARIDAEAASINSLFDAEAATLDAPTYALEKAQRELLGQLEDERREARSRHRQCRDGAGPVGDK